ncbi:MAG: helix-turn-helix domain-containing protein, partial [Methylohalobius sp.]|nr:helix-turn-helix domain-containing protein [Methylohalobius sp.]
AHTLPDTTKTKAEVGLKSALGQDLRSREEQLILAILKEENGSRILTARRLGISPRTLRYKLARMRQAGVLLPQG